MLVCTRLTVNSSVILVMLLVWLIRLTLQLLLFAYSREAYSILGSINTDCSVDSIDLMNPYVRADSIMGLQTVRA